MSFDIEKEIVKVNAAYMKTFRLEPRPRYIPLNRSPYDADTSAEDERLDDNRRGQADDINRGRFRP